MLKFSPRVARQQIEEQGVGKLRVGKLRIENRGLEKLRAQEQRVEKRGAGLEIGGCGIESRGVKTAAFCR